ncbi:MAG: sigma 54-interacting transcriptional regulator [Stenotrophobium sp.]
MFWKNSDHPSEVQQVMSPQVAPYLQVFANDLSLRATDDLAILEQRLPEGGRCEFMPISSSVAGVPLRSDFLLSLFVEPSQLDGLVDQVLAARRNGRMTTLIVAINPLQLAALGRWLDRRANEGRLGGVRLLLAQDIAEVAEKLDSRLVPVREDNVIRMPMSTEVENSPVRNFYVFSPELQALVARIRGFARNGIMRCCLLGGPGSGKTSLAYYYFLVRERGRFVSVNLSAENTGDKAAIKSLLCGHVSGAFPGAGSRTGAFAHARDGVCFLDESHGVTGAVMEVLMEALDNGQYLPYGASAKQQMESALLFATNRSWEHLQNAVNLDEFTRMGASVLEVPELATREEDMIAVIATTLARLSARCTSWTAVAGLSAEAWRTIRECRWHGNVRGLVRTLESAFVDTASVDGGEVIREAEVERGIALWEPKVHHSHQLYGTH